MFGIITLICMLAIFLFSPLLWVFFRFVYGYDTSIFFDYDNVCKDDVEHETTQFLLQCVIEQEQQKTIDERRFFNYITSLDANATLGEFTKHFPEYRSYHFWCQKIYADGAKVDDCEGAKVVGCNVTG
jgi:hypothetical protein